MKDKDNRRMDDSKLLWHMDRVIEHFDKGNRVVPIHIDWGLSKFCDSNCVFCFGIFQNIKKEYIKREPLLRAIREAGEIGDYLLEQVRKAYDRHEEEIGAERMRAIEKFLLLQNIDTKWKDHLRNMDEMKSGIGMRGYAQVDPKVEYTREARQMFDEMEISIAKEVTDFIMKVEVRGEEEESESIWRMDQALHPGAADARNIREQQDSAIAGSQGAERPRPIERTERVGRNDPCPCGSGKKFKKCCGKAG